MKFKRRAWLGVPVLLGLVALFGQEPLAEARRDFNVAPLPYDLTYVSGRATLSPHVLSARTSNHYLTLTTVVDEPILPGGRVDLIFGAQVVELAGQPKLYAPQVLSWRPFQNDGPDQPDYIQVDPVPGISFKLMPESMLQRMRKVYHYFGTQHEETADYSAKEMTANLHRVPLKLGDKPLPAGTPLVWRLGGKPGEAVGMAASPRQTRIHVAALVDAKGDGHFRLIKDPPILDVVGGIPNKTRLVAPSVVRPQAPIPVTVQVLDEKEELASGFEGTLELGVRGTNVHTTVHLTPDDLSQGTATLPALPEGRYFLEVSGRCSLNCYDPRIHAAPPPDAATGGKAGASSGASADEKATAALPELVWDGTTLRMSVQPLIVRADGPLLLWGDTHRHSVIADGFVTPQEVYRRALKEEHLDWMCLSEHSHPDPFDAFGTYRRRLDLTPAEWMGLQQLADRFDALPDFTALQGYEWSSNAGHRNVYFHPDESPMPLLNHRRADGEMPVPEFLETFRDRKVIIIPHHPAWRLWGTPYEWGDRLLADKLQRVVEIYSQHGNSEFYNNPRPIHGGDNLRPAFLPFAKMLIRGRMISAKDQAPEGAPGFVRNALAAGFKMAMIGSSDNHFYDTGPISYAGGLAGVYTGENSRAGIWNGLHDRSAIGSSGVRMILELTAGGVGIGQEGAVRPEGRNDKGQLRLVGQVMGTARLQKVEILRHDARGYATVLSATSSSGELDGESLNIDLADPDFQGSGFYYLRVEQQDGNLGWAGPIWLTAT